MLHSCYIVTCYFCSFYQSDGLVGGIIHISNAYNCIIVIVTTICIVLLKLDVFSSKPFIMIVILEKVMEPFIYFSVVMAYVINYYVTVILNIWIWEESK